MNAESRLAALRTALKDADAGAMLVTSIPNVVYLTGFDGVLDDHANATCLVTADRARLYTDHRYSAAALRAAHGTEWEVLIPAISTEADACRSLQEEGVTRLRAESTMPHARFIGLAEQFVGRVEGSLDTIERLREVKSPEELERIEAAARLTDRAFEHICTFVSAGLTEREIALELEVFMRRHGSEGLAFPPIVASGPNSALPHATVTERSVAAGDLLKLDFGARVGGYCADMTRTIVVGKASDRQRELHDAVLAANRAGLAAVRAGVSGRDADAAARASLASAGLSECFTHGLGHGVGLEVHERPGLGQKSADVLSAGAVVTVEPGVYVEGFGGVRIEDLVEVREDGARVLSASPRHLIEV